MNALVVIDTLTPAIFSEEGGIDAMLSSLEAKVRAVPTDISTPNGRAAIKSLAHQVARSKTAFDEMGKELVSDWKAKSKAVDKERARVWDRLEALQAEVRKPLTDWEDAEKARVQEHEFILTAIGQSAVFIGQPTTAEISERLAELTSQPERDWQEFAKRAESARADSFAKLTVMKADAEKREAEAADLARLRAEQAEREQKERDALIASQAAETARLAAEAKAAQEKQDAADKADEETRRLQAEKKAADDRATKAEREATEAVERERQRVADAQAAESAAAEKREANKRHARKINNEVLAALVGCGVDEKTGMTIIASIVRGEVPHTKISY